MNCIGKPPPRVTVFMNADDPIDVNELTNAAAMSESSPVYDPVCVSRSLSSTLDCLMKSSLASSVKASQNSLFSAHFSTVSSPKTFCTTSLTPIERSLKPVLVSVIMLFIELIIFCPVDTSLSTMFPSRS